MELLSPLKQEVLYKYAEQVLTCQQEILSKSGQSILQFMLDDNQVHYKNKHYPQGDRIDFKNGGQYFYHCHRENHTTNEHGHFHCYLRRSAIPSSIEPMHIPNIPLKIGQQMTHIVAIALNRLGQPIRLFTLNYWITREVAYDAKFAQNLTSLFKLDINDESKWTLIDKWVEGVIQIFMPQIIWSQKLRDQKLDLLKKKEGSEQNIYESNKVEEISSISIDLVKQIQWIINNEKLIAPKHMAQT